MKTTQTKTLLILALSILSVSRASSAEISIPFDNYISATQNDLLSNFLVQDGAFSQSQSGGISGGALIPKSSTSWANTKALSNYRFSTAPGTAIISSIDFKYDASIVNPNQFERPVGIFLNPSRSSNNYIMAYPQRSSGSHELQVFTYSWAASNSGAAATIPLTNGWHRLTLTVTIIGGTFGDQISIHAEIFNLGNTGLSTPVSLGVTQGVIYDTYLASDPAVFISLHGSQWGGAQALDNFRISGPITDGSGELVNQTISSSIERAVKVKWNSSAGKKYTVEWTSDLGSGNWSELHSNLSGTGGVMHIYDGLGDGLNRFYRIKEY